MHTISTAMSWDDEECPSVTTASTVMVEYEYVPPPPDIDMPRFNPSMDGIRSAAKRHDALARRKYVKPFKWFKFNRARKATAK